MTHRLFLLWEIQSIHKQINRSGRQLKQHFLLSSFRIAGTWWNGGGSGPGAVRLPQRARANGHLPGVPGNDRHHEQARPACRQVSALHGGDPHSQCATRQEVRPLSVQLSADLQDLVTANRVPSHDLQTDHQSGAESRDTAHSDRAGNVQGHLRPLQRHVLGEREKLG